MRIDLAGKVVLVTGASRGIGAATARAFGAAGASVAVHYRERSGPAEAVARDAGNGAAAIAADISSAEGCARLWSSVMERYGRVDVLVNNAGSVSSASPSATDEEWAAVWREMMQVNLDAAAWLSRAAVSHFVTHGGGRVVSISSRVAFRGGADPHWAYATSKGGLVTLTRTIARSYGKKGVAAFTVAPGFVRTEQSAPFIAQVGEAKALEDIALPRLTEPEDVAPLIVFLASGLADHATGSTIDVNAGGYTH